MRLQKLNMKPFLVFLKIVELLSVQDLQLVEHSLNPKLVSKLLSQQDLENSTLQSMVLLMDMVLSSNFLLQLLKNLWKFMPIRLLSNNFSILWIELKKILAWPLLWKEMLIDKEKPISKNSQTNLKDKSLMFQDKLLI